MLCPNCGQEVGGRDRFCHFCGWALADSRVEKPPVYEIVKMPETYLYGKKPGPLEGQPAKESQQDQVPDQPGFFTGRRFLRLLISLASLGLLLLALLFGVMIVETIF